MKNNTFILLIFALFFSFGCSKEAGKSEAKFKIGLAALTDINAVGAGGAMLWGRSDKGDMFGSVITPSSGMELSLVNGQWTFWSVAWEGNGSGTAFTGTVRCAKAQALLNGTDVQVNLSLSNAKCDQQDFSPSVTVNAGIKQFPSISTHECQKLSDHNGIGCGEGIASGKTVSRRFVLSSFIKPASGSLVTLPAKLVSACRPVGVYFANEHLPLGNGVMPALAFLDSFYSSSSCDETDPKGFRRSAYEYGLLGTAKLDTIKFVNEGTCDATGFSFDACTKFNGSYSSSCNLNTNQFEISQAACVANGGVYTANSTMKNFQLITAIPEGEVCSGPRVNVANNSPHPFASGDGSIASPYTICKEAQLNAIGENATAYTGSHFSLQADLDMNKTSILGNGEQPIPTCLTNPGANFIPIGGLYNNVCSQVPAETFSGSFNGNGHMISNIRLEGKNDDLGFIRVGGTISNLILKKIEVEGKSNVGGVSGRGAAEIKNVTVLDGRIRGDSNVAGIAGHYTGMSVFLNNHAKKVDIDGNGTAGAVFGGLIGFDDNSGLTIRLSSFQGFIRSHAQGESIGGLLGKGSSGINVYVYESFSNGAILASGSSGACAGGLLGNMSGPVTIIESYSQMSIGHSIYNNTFGSGKIGGLVAYSGGSTNINYSYYYGSIMNPCNKNTVYCSVGTLLGSGTPTLNNSQGALLTPSWYTTMPSDNTNLATIESGSFKASLVAGGKYKDVGTPLPKLTWENDICSTAVANEPLATQASTRGLTAANPMVICNKEQWASIKDYPNRIYGLAGNIALGEFAHTNIPSAFAGAIEGNNFLVTGFKSTIPTGSGGLFIQNNGRIGGIHFAAGDITSSATAAAVGVVGINNTNAVMTKNKFDSISMSGMSNKKGVIAGENYGSITLSKVESAMEANSRFAGMGVGVNQASGSIVGVRVSGMINIANAVNDIVLGGLAGTNYGIVQEVDTGVNLNNPVNNDPATYVGALIGDNAAIVKDALIRPYASINFSQTSPKYGSVFGKTSGGSNVMRVISTNEIPYQTPMDGAAKPLVYDNDAGAIYNNLYVLNGAVFKYNEANALTISSCSVAGSLITHNFSAAFNEDPSFPDGYYFMSMNGGGDRISRRITGSHTTATSVLLTNDLSDYFIPCDSNGIQAGSILNQIASVTDINYSGVAYIQPRDFSAMTTFCPSASSQAGNTNYKCLANEFDIVEDTNVGGIGFNRLKAAYSAIVNNTILPANRPVWTVDDEGFPRLFLVD